jgi:hypothetical protein
MPDGFEVIKLGEVATRVEHDPDNTMFLSIDRKELLTLLFGLHFVMSLFPELSDTVKQLTQKIQETGEAQEFINGFDL